MKKILSYVLTLAIIISSTGCCSQESSAPKSNEWENVELPEDEIILVAYYANYAWTPTCTGRFITGDGLVYSFDFSKYITEDNFNREAEMQKLIDADEADHKINEDFLKEIYYYSSKIDPNAKMGEMRNVSMDAGEKYIDVYVESAGLIMISMDGDVVSVLDDKYAKKVKNLYETKANKKIKLRYDR